MAYKCNKRNSSYREMYLAAGTFLYVTRGLRKKRTSRGITVPSIETCGETGGIQTRFNIEKSKNMSRKVFDEQRTFSLERNANVKHMVTAILDLILRTTPYKVHRLL